jgi:hypothetical protein
MIVLLLLLAAGAFGFADQIKALAQRVAAANPPAVSTRHLAAAALVAAAAVMFAWPATEDDHEPAPPPVPASLSLVGKFVGPSAAMDAAITAGLTAELADELEWDGTQQDPVVKTGQAVEMLRTRARELRCAGEALGTKHPLAREAIGAFLDAKAGQAGGNLTPASRAAWVEAFREISKAAAEAVR